MRIFDGINGTSSTISEIQVAIIKRLLNRIENMGIPWRDDVTDFIDTKLPRSVSLARYSADQRLLAASAHALEKMAVPNAAVHLISVMLVKEAPLEEILGLFAKSPGTLCAIHIVRPESALLPLMAPQHRRQILSVDMDL